MSVVDLIVRVFLPVVGTVLAEVYFLPEKLPMLYAASSVIPFLSKAYGLVILFNVVFSTIVMIILGAKVSGARKSCMEKAKKEEDDKFAEERFSYPKLYAEGFSKSAKLFNCIQRGHQQALETYASFVVMSLVGGIKFPLTSAFGGFIWLIARFAWADGYATGEPNQRYSAFTAIGVWTSLVMVLVAAIGTSIAFFR